MPRLSVSKAAAVPPTAENRACKVATEGPVEASCLVGKMISLLLEIESV